VTSFQDSALGRDDFPLPQEAVSSPVYQLAPQQTARKAATSYPMSFPKRVPPPVAPAPVPVDEGPDPYLEAAQAAYAPKPEPIELPDPQYQRRFPEVSPDDPSMQRRLGTFDEKLDQDYGMTPGYFGTTLLAPGEGEIVRRSPKLDGGPGKSMAAPEIGYTADAVRALGEGVRSATGAAQGIVGIGGGLVNKALGGDFGLDTVRKSAGITGNLAKRAELDAENEGPLWKPLRGAIAMAPLLAGEIAAGVASGGTAGFLMAAGAADAGQFFNEELAKARESGMSERGAIGSALQAASIAGATSVLSNALPVGMLAKGSSALNQAGKMAVLSSVGKKIGSGAFTGAAVGGATQMGMEFAVALKRQSEQEFDKFFKENPEWVSDIMARSFEGAKAGALLGGALGPILHGSSPASADDAIGSPRFIRNFGEKYRTQLAAGKWNEQMAKEWADYEGKRSGLVHAAVAQDIAFQRTAGQALDLSPLPDETLAAVAAGTDTGQTANIRGTAEVWTVTPAMAAQEMAQRAKEANPKHPIVGLDVSPDGSVTDAALSAWVAGSRTVAEGMAKGMSRAQMERATGRKDIRWSAEQRKALSDRIALEVAKPEVAPVAPPRPDSTAEVMAAVKDLSPTEREMARKGLSPETARLVTHLNSYTAQSLGDMVRAQMARHAPEAPEKAPSEAGAVEAPATAPEAGKPTASDPGPALAALARANKVDPEAVKEAVPDEGQKRIVEFGKSLGVEVRHFDGPPEMTTAGAMHDGVMWLNAATKEPAARWAVAIHETLDSLHAADSGLWRELHAVLKEHAPDALAEAARRYGVRLGEQGGEVTPEVLHREGASNVAEVLVEAFGLHAGIDGSGRVDRARVAAMVDSNPGVFAKVVRFLRAALAKVGIGRKETGLNDAQAAMLERAIGGKGRELANPGVRRLIATKLADTLNEAMKLKGEPAPAKGKSELTQSVRSPIHEDERRFLENEMTVEERDNHPGWSRSTEALGLHPRWRKVKQGNLAEILPNGTELVHHETSLAGLKAIVGRSMLGPRDHHPIFVSENIDLALGQGGKGYVIGFDPERVNGFKPKGKVSLVLSESQGMGSEYAIDKTLRSSVRSIIAPNERGIEALKKITGIANRFDFNNATKVERGIKVDRIVPKPKEDITQSIREKSPEKVEQEQAVEKKGIAKGVKVGVAVARAVARRKAADMAFSAQEKINVERMAASVSGEKNGIAKGLKVGAAVARAKARREAADMRFTEQAKIDDLRERMAASVSDEKLKGRTERKVIKDSIKLAERVVSVLPKDMKGDYLADVAKADTPEKALAVAQDVVHDLAMIPLHDLREKGRKMSERLGAKGISTAAKESARESLDAAHALLTGDRGRLVKYESVEMAAQRKAAAEQHLAAAKQAMDESQHGYKEAVKDRAINLSNDIKAVGAEIAAMKPLAEDADGLGGHRRSPLSVALGSIANKDIHTIGEAVGPTFSRIFSDARAAEGAHDLHHAEVMNKVNAALVEAGFDSIANYARRAKGELGEASAESITVTIGGKKRTISLDRALKFAMEDSETMKKIEGGEQKFVLSQERNAAPVVVTKADVDAMRAAIDPKILAAAEKIKKIVNDDTFQRAADATMRLTGRQPKPIDGYLMTRRHGDAVNSADVLMGDNPIAAVVTDLPSMRERTSTSAPFVSMGFMDAINQTVEGNLFLIHLAEPGQHAMRVLRSEGVRTGIERAYGEKMNESLRSLLLNGLRITGKPTGDMVERASGMVAGAKVLVNPASLGVQVGGMFRVASEMPPGAMHEGMAKSLTMSPKERSAYADRMMARNGYLTHRWSESQVGMYAGVLGESASGKAMMKEASRAIRDSAKAATTALAKGRIMEAAKAVGSSVGAAVKFLRSLEQAQRAVDRQIGVSTALGFDAHLRKSQPHLTEAQRFDAAVALTEQAFRRTQNVSSAFDDTMFMANGRQKRNLSRLLFPFTSDPLKGYNQWQRAWASGDPTQIGRTAYALGANAAWGAGMRPLAAAGTLALTGAFSSNDERRKAATRAAITDSAWGAGVRLGGDALSVLAGYQGQMIGSIAQQFVAGRPVDVGGGILAIGAANDAFNSALRGDWLRSGMAASELAGVPLAAVARHGKGAYELATGANEDKQARKQMSKEVREGTASAEVESTLKSDRAKESAAARAYKRGVVTPDLTDAIRSRVDKAIAREKVRKAARSER